MEQQPPTPANSPVPEQDQQQQPLPEVDTYYCLKCRTKRPVVDMEYIQTSFKSIKRGRDMCRHTATGKCSVCGISVRSFKKKPVEQK